MRYLVLLALVGCGLPQAPLGRSSQELADSLQLVLEPDADMDVYACSNPGLTVRATAEGGKVYGRRLYGILVQRGGQMEIDPEGGAEAVFTPVEGGVQLRARTVYPYMGFLVEWRAAYVDELGRETFGPPVRRAYHVKD